MFIVWRKKVITSDKKTELFHTYSTFGERFKYHPAFDGIAWAPLWCEHAGPGRITWTPALIHMERVNGKPRQKLLRKFPALRSCCITDKASFVLAAWWHCIDDWQELLRTTTMNGEEGDFFQRDRKAILAKLREVSPKPSKKVVAAFTAYREQKEAESRAYYEETMAYAEATGQFRSFHFGGSSSTAEPTASSCWAILGLKPTATADELKARHRELSLKHHPDRGGKHEDFVKFQAAFEEAREILRRRSA